MTDAMCSILTPHPSKSDSEGLRPELVTVTDSSVEAMTGDIPEPIVWWWRTSAIGYLEVVVRAAGGKDGGIRFHEPQLETVRHGVRSMKVPNTTYWG